MPAVLSIIRIMIKETLRSRVFWGLMAFMLLFLGFAIYISSLSLDTPDRFILNASMAGLSLVGLAATILVGLYTMYEARNRYERYVLFNRIPRAGYLAGKFCGTVVILALFLAFSSAAVFLLTRIMAGVFAFEIFIAALWALLEFSLVMAVGILFYCLNTSFPLNAMMVMAVYGVGHSIRETLLSFQGLGRYGSELHYTLVKAVAVVFPDFDFFNFRLALLHHEPVPAGKILVSAGYWACYLAGLLLVSAWILRQKDI